MLFESGGADDSSFDSGALSAGGGGAELDTGGEAAVGADASAAGGGGAALASPDGAGGGAAAGVGASAFGAGAFAFFSSFLSLAPSIFEASAAVGKSALIVALLKGARFFFSFRNQLLKPPTYHF